MGQLYAVGVWAQPHTTGLGVDVQPSLERANARVQPFDLPVSSWSCCKVQL